MHASKPPCLILSAVQVLLLDEITVDMDVVGRLDLLQFFKQECAERGATIIYVRRGGRLNFSRALLRLALFRLGMLGRLHLEAFPCIHSTVGKVISTTRSLPQEPEPSGRAVMSTCPQATHIFDGLESWPTHFAYLENGRMLRGGRLRLPN